MEPESHQEVETVIIIAEQKFQLGRLLSTPGALERADEHGLDLSMLVARHASGSWGDLDESDQALNEQALQSGGRLFSAYGQGAQRLYIITEADRAATTILRPEDY